MSSGFDDDNFDWTGGEQGGAPAVSSALDFVIPSFDSGTDVEALEQEQEQKDREWAENRFRDPAVGTHLFLVEGFPRGVERITKTGYVDGKPVSYSPYKVSVRFAVVGSPKETIVKYMELPPGNAKENAIYRRVMGKPDGKVGGWFCREFEQFISRLGYHIEEGKPYPPEALAIRNWVGKQVYITIEKGKEDKTRINQATGEPYPARNQIKSFSFRQAESTVAGNGGPAPRPVGAKAPVGTHAESFVKAGLGNI